MKVRYYGDKIEKNNKAISLCGPTTRSNKIISWRKERECYINSNVIVFWVPRKFPSMLGLTTNVEFGYWLKSKKCIYGRPDDSYRTDYLDWLYNLEYNKKPENSLDELLRQAVKMSEEDKK